MDIAKILKFQEIYTECVIDNTIINIIPIDVF